MFPVQHSAAAPALDSLPHSEPRTVDRPVPTPLQLVRDVPKSAPSQGGPAVQPSLFGPMEVVRSTPTKPPRTTAPRRKAERPHQQQFDFGSHTLPTSVEAAVACNAEVALPTARVTAALVDTAIPLAGLILFTATFHVIDERIILSPQTLPFFGAAALLITLFYRVLCCIGNVDTVGLQWAGLRLVSLHGHRPGRRERFRRLAGGIVSTVSLGIGLLWALTDEEHLTWHDYMSRTFPTHRFRNV